MQSLGFSLYSGRSAAHSATSTLQRIDPVVFPAPASCPHRFAKLHEDCCRSLPPLRRERRFALQSSLMDPGVAVNREPAHSRIRTSHTRLPCVSLSLSVETVRAFGQLWAPRSHISALIPAFSCVVISVGWLLYRHGWPSVSHGYDDEVDREQNRDDEAPKRWVVDCELVCTACDRDRQKATHADIAASQLRSPDTKTQG